MSDRPHAAEGTTVRRETHDPASTPSATYVLLVVDGPDRGLSFTLDGTGALPVLIGHGPSCHLRVSDRQVSRRHAAIDMVDRRLRLTDLASTNGTLVNGVAVVDAYLNGGETLRMGQTSVRVDRLAPATVVPLSAETSFGGLVGASVEMRRLYPVCERLAASTVSAVIEGETGTGKEVLAESLHERGPRAEGPFVVFDCTAAHPTLLESELFGHERGAFTGAVATRKGVFERADGGTLLIDEIGDLDLALQPKLLRLLERAEIRRVGGDRPIKVDVRVLCATRRDLDREVQAGRFRDDLFHRLAVARIELPPLRRRRGDVPILARWFVSQLGGHEAALPDALLAQWQDYAWPGNVRELRNAVARRLALGEFAQPPGSSSVVGKEGATALGVMEEVLSLRLPLSEARHRLLEEFERRYLAQVLAEHGTVARAAEASGVGRRYFQRLRARSE